MTSTPRIMRPIVARPRGDPRGGATNPSTTLARRVKKLLRPPAVFVLLAVVVLVAALAAMKLGGSDSGTRLTLAELQAKVRAGEAGPAPHQGRGPPTAGRVGPG